MESSQKQILFKFNVGSMKLSMLKIYITNIDQIITQLNHNFFK